LPGRRRAILPRKMTVAEQSQSREQRLQ